MNFKASALLATILLLVVPAFGERNGQATDTTVYRISARLLREEGRATGKIRIESRNNAAMPLKAIHLSLMNSAAYETSEQLRSALTGEPTVNGARASVEWKEKGGSEAPGGFVLIPETPVEAGARFSIEAVFSTSHFPYDFGFFHFVEDWFPMLQVMIDGQPQPGIQSSANFEAELTFPADYKVALTGKIEQRRSNRDGTVTIIAAARDLPEFGVLLSKEFSEASTEAAGVKIISYWLPGDEKWGRKLLEYAADIVTFYRREIGFYPQPVLYILPGYNAPWGGYPVTPNCIVIHRNLDTLGEPGRKASRTGSRLTRSATSTGASATSSRTRVIRNGLAYRWESTPTASTPNSENWETRNIWNSSKIISEE